MFQIPTALHFKLFSILITYCIILSRIITYVRNPVFLQAVDKLWFVYYPYPVFLNVILREE